MCPFLSTWNCVPGRTSTFIFKITPWIELNNVCLRAMITFTETMDLTRSRMDKLRLPQDVLRYVGKLLVTTVSLTLCRQKWCNSFCIICPSHTYWKCRWEDNSKSNIRKLDCRPKCSKLLAVAQDRVKWRAFIMDLWVSYQQVITWIAKLPHTDHGRYFTIKLQLLFISVYL
jgi:hypothetical protein